MKEFVLWDIGVDGPVKPTKPLPSMPEIPRGSLLVIGGRGPIWRYGMALHKAHAWVSSCGSSYI